MEYEYDCGQYDFVDFEDLSDEIIQVLLDCKNQHRYKSDSLWTIEAKFPAAFQAHSPWWNFLRVEDFFTYTKGKHSKQQPKYMDIQATETFKRLPLDLLQKLAAHFRQELDSEEYEYLDDNPEVIFTPLFEKEVATHTNPPTE
jgi:hypothetical protein